MGTPDHNDELGEVPGLRSIPKIDPFVVPGGFFERFPHAVQQRISEDRGRPPVFGVWLGPAMGSFAILAVVLVAWVLWPRSTSDLPGIAVNTYETPEHISDDLDADEIFAALSTDDPLLAEVDLTLTDAELAEYVEQEELPLDLLIEEL